MIRIHLFVTACAAILLCACSSETPADIGDTPTEVSTELSPYFVQTDTMIDLSGQSIRYRETGPPEAQPVVLLHGFTDSLHTWDAVADLLDDEFRVIRPDLPGHGLSGPAPDMDYSNAALIRFTGEFLRAVDANDAVLVGNSLGGLAAWRTTASHPDRIAGLVLLSPGGVPHSGLGDDPAKVPAMLRLYLSSAPDLGVRAALSAMHANPDHVTYEQVERFRALMLGHGDAFVARAAAFTLPDPAEDLARITVPTTILWGAQDAVLPPDHAAVFKDNIPNADAAIVEQVGHMPQSEAPDRVAQAIRTIAAKANKAP